MTQATDGTADTGRMDADPLGEAVAGIMGACDLAPQAISRTAAPWSAQEIKSVEFALRIESRIRRRLRHLLGSYQEVSDLVQDVYVQLLSASRRRSEAIRSEHAYVMTVARNKTLDWIRRQKVIATLCPTIDMAHLEVPDEGTQPDEMASSQEELEVLSRAIHALPERCQHIYILHRVCGVSHKNIARSLGISVHTIEQHMTRASQLLDQFLSPYGPGYSLIYAVRKSRARSKAHMTRTLPSASDVR